MNTLSRETLESILATISFKNWEFVLAWGKEHSSYSLTLSFSAPDVACARFDGRTYGDPNIMPIVVVLVLEIPRNSLQTPESFIDFVYGAVAQFEKHERDEWFWVNGEHYNKPH